MRPLVDEPSILTEARASLGSRPRGVTHLFRGSLEDLLHPPANQISFLHGLRAIAVLLVINFHVSETFIAAHHANAYTSLPFVSNGWIGVDLFLILSGFFIGGQLWKELWKSGAISFRRFAVRRGLRIWPLHLFTFLCVLIVFPGHAAAKQFGWTDLVFVTNYLDHGIVPGAWSLCTEEQFYLLAPLLLSLFAWDQSRRWSVRVLWLLVLALPIGRAIIWMHHTGSLSAHDPVLFSSALYFRFHTHCDGLLVGLILAHQWIRHNRPSASHWKAAGIALLGLFLLLLLRYLQHEVLIFTGLALFFGSVVWAGLVGRVMLFRGRIFYWLSRLSFGMYLNHRCLESFVLNSLSPRLHAFSPASITGELFATLLLVLLSAVVSLATFCLVEHPFLHLRSRLLEPAPQLEVSHTTPAHAGLVARAG